MKHFETTVTHNPVELKTNQVPSHTGSPTAEVSVFQENTEPTPKVGEPGGMQALGGKLEAITAAYQTASATETGPQLSNLEHLKQIYDKLVKQPYTAETLFIDHREIAGEKISTRAIIFESPILESTPIANDKGDFIATKKTSEIVVMLGTGELYTFQFPLSYHDVDGKNIPHNKVDPNSTTAEAYNNGHLETDKLTTFFDDQKKLDGNVDFNDATNPNFIQIGVSSKGDIMLHFPHSRSPSRKLSPVKPTDVLGKIRQVVAPSRVLNEAKKEKARAEADNRHTLDAATPFDIDEVAKLISFI